MDPDCSGAPGRKKASESGAVTRLCAMSCHWHRYLGISGGSLAPSFWDGRYRMLIVGQRRSDAPQQHVPESSMLLALRWLYV